MRISRKYYCVVCDKDFMSDNTIHTHIPKKTRRCVICGSIVDRISRESRRVTV